MSETNSFADNRTKLKLSLSCEIKEQMIPKWVYVLLNLSCSDQLSRWEMEEMSLSERYVRVL